MALRNALPVLFLSHGGGPAHLLSMGGMFSPIDKNSQSAAFFRGLRSSLAPYTHGQQIKCIVVISAHWEESQFTVGYQDKGTSLIYDYYG